MGRDFVERGMLKCTRGYTSFRIHLNSFAIITIIVMFVVPFTINGNEGQ